MRYLLLAVLGVGLSRPALGQTPDTSARQAVLQAERARHDAMLRGDAAALGRLLADDYIGTGAHGKVRSKAAVLAEYSSGALKYQSLSDEDVAVRLYGTAAVVTGRTNSKGKEAGKDVEGAHRFTRVWVHAAGGWLLVATHSSPAAR